MNEVTMTSAQKRKDTMLKKKYDDSDMKKSMQKQYGKEEGKKVYFATIRKQAMEGVEDDKYNVSEEGLRDWFGKSSGTTKSGRKVRGWVQVGGKYDGKPCARQPGQKSTPKCVSSSKRRSMSKSERDSAARRKRAADPNQPQKSGAAKPTNVSTDPKRKMKENYFNQNKVYKFNVVFGELKDTDDITGRTIKKSNIIPSLNEIDQYLIKFIGVHDQVPPNYSAVKVNGKRAYKLARNNQKFLINSKKVFIEGLKCLGSKNVNEYCFILECSSGTYVRSIARDLGKMLGTCAYVSELRRVKIGKIDEKDIILLDKFEELVHIGDHFEVMHSIRDVLDDIPAVLIDQELSLKFRNGLSFEYHNKKSENDYLLIETNTKFVGIGKAIEGKIKPVRVFNL